MIENVSLFPKYEWYFTFILRPFLEIYTFDSMSWNVILNGIFLYSAFVENSGYYWWWQVGVSVSSWGNKVPLYI